MRTEMERGHELRVIVGVAVTLVIAAATAWTRPAPAAIRGSSVAGTVSCTSLQGSMQISAYAYRPSVGIAGIFVYTGPPNTPATVDLVAIQSGASKYALDQRCGRTKASVRLTHRGLSSAGVVKAGYDQSLTVYCGVPSRILVRYRIGYASSGRPATANVAIWAKRKKSSKLHEIGYVQWSRSRSTTYYAAKSCVAQS
jgi:hypothetical protein